MALALLLSTGQASAQQGEPDGPRYVVQPGDTLSSIALRFDTPMNDIIAASDLADPNSLNVGDVLVIPGINWIDGTLVFEDIPYGESFLSLQRRYLLPEESLARLNRVTSPDQLYAGFSVMLATERGELSNRARVAVGVGSSLLELAAANGENPWAMVAVNQLPGTWAAVPGDVLFTVGREGAGPGGLPSPITALGVEDPGFMQGRASVVNVAGSGALSLGGELLGRELHFFPESETNWVAIQGVGLTTTPGIYTLTITGTFDEADFAFSQPIRVLDGNYASETLTVGAEFLDSDLSDAESAIVRELVAPASDQKLWQGLWGWPHPYVGVINSEYGTHRLYNGGSYEGYHYGVDFGGGIGIEIWAPAAGRVVFAGPMDVRGNATLIDHGWGIYTGYFHQSEIMVAAGDIVEPGQLIGLVGGTGRVSGAHLHWEVWANGEPVQPMDWLNRVFP